MLDAIERGDTFSFDDAWAPLSEVYADHLLVLVGVPIVLGFAYWCGFLRWRGATPGKLMCGLRVRRRSEDGRLSWGTITTRFLVQSGPGYVVLPLAVATGSFGLFLAGQLLRRAVLRRRRAHGARLAAPDDPRPGRPDGGRRHPLTARRTP